MSKIDKDKLYTVNKWNKVAFMPENRFGYGDQMNTGMKPLETYLPTGLSNDTYRKLAIGSLGAEQNAFHNYGKSVVDNFGKNGLVYPTNNLSVNSTDANAFFSDGTSGKTTSNSGNGINWGGVGMAAASAIGDIPTGDKRGMWDTLDPVYHIAGGRESAAGNAMSDTGVALAKTGNPWLMLAGAGLKVVGGLTNAAFGVKTNQERLKGVESGIAQNSNFYSNAKSFDDIHGPAAVATNTDVYEGGWFSGSKARRKNEELRERMLAAKDWADRSVDNNIYNISADQLSDALGNYSAFGGPIGRSAVVQHYTGQDNTNNMGAIDYGFMSDYLTMRNRQAEQKDKMGNMFTGMPSKMFDFGGDMQSNSADYSTGLTHIDAGGTHEENVHDGVQIGTDSEGVPNLVEEGEVIFDDYVYSARIKMDDAAKERFHIGKKKDYTYAEFAKKLEKEIAERPNDAISKAGFKAQMQDLAEEQERQKQEMEAERAKAAFEALSPEEQVALMEEVSARENLAAQAEQEQAVAQQAMQQPSPEEAAMMQQQMMQADGNATMVGQEPSAMAEGGRLYGNGSVLVKKPDGSTDFEQSVFEIPEVVVSPEHPIPVSVEAKPNPLEMMAMMKEKRDREKMNAYLEEAIEKLQADKIKKGEIHYYDDGGELRDALFKIIGVKDIPEYLSWLKENNGKHHLYSSNMTDPNYDWYSYPWEESIYNLYQQPSIRELASDGDWDNLLKQAWNRLYDSFVPSMQYAFDNYGINSLDTYYKTPFDLLFTTSELYDTWKENPKWKDYTVRQLLNEPIFGQGTGQTYSDLGRSISDNSFEDVRFSDITPQQWKSIYDSYMDDYNKFTASYPNIPYGIRNENVYKGRWDDSYKDYKTEVEDAIVEQQANDEEESPVLDYTGEGSKSQVQRNDSGLIDFDNSTFGLPEVAIIKKRNPSIDLHNQKSAKERGVINQPDEQASAANSERRVNPVYPMGMNPIFEDTHSSKNAGIFDVMSTSSTPESKVGTVAPVEITKAPIKPATKIVPVLKKEWPRYVGLFGPGVGLGMMAAGIGKPDYSGMEEALAKAARSYHTATAQYLGNYLKYQPMDIWYNQAKMDAQSRATDRNIMNTSGSNRGNAMAGIIANGYNSQLASGDLYRKSLEYNNALKKQTEEFNRGTDMFNAQTYNQNQQFNTSEANRAGQFNAQLAMQAAREKLSNDAGWYNSLYGNVNNLFKGVSDLGRENADRNWIARLAASGYFGTLNNAVNAGLVKEVSAEGGKLKRKKNKRRGLTF